MAYSPTIISTGQFTLGLNGDNDIALFVAFFHKTVILCLGVEG